MINDLFQILNEERTFCEKSSAQPDKDNAHHRTKIQHNKISFLNKKYPKITTSERMKCEVAINEHTCVEAVSKLKNGKSPGIDGLPAGF